ncbi:MAG: DUF2281 domain-containing protein [Defluviitaleaceae bacterium]|nr:DUF2281 domain-containing protein [Defluviitaleaceae bacterium]MCL2239724.1 DUF2281 domain-containing protein [Defluviitaleaceae bacterium]
MYSVKAIYDGVNFKPTQPIDVEGQYEVVITFLEPVPTKKNPRLLLEPVLGKPVSIGEFDGLIKIPDDFDEPLEEMKEYMF